MRKCSGCQHVGAWTLYGRRVIGVPGFRRVHPGGATTGPLPSGHPPVQASVGFIPAGPQLVRYPLTTATHLRSRLQRAIKPARGRPNQAAACFGLVRASVVPADARLVQQTSRLISSGRPVGSPWDELDGAGDTCGTEMGLYLDANHGKFLSRQEPLTFAPEVVASGATGSSHQ